MQVFILQKVPLFSVCKPSSNTTFLIVQGQCLRPPYGVLYVAGKKHYFGVGGGTRQFKHLVEDDGTISLL